MISSVQAALGGFLTAEDRAAAEQIRLQELKEAEEWLYIHFGEVHPGEVGDRLAHDIRTMLDWDQECNLCHDTSRCRHSRAVLTICEEHDCGGFRSFVARAKMCDKNAMTHMEQSRGREYNVSGIPEERQRNTLEAFRPATPALNAALGMAYRCLAQHRSLLLGGSVGCGKTHLAIGIGLSALENGESVRFWLLPDLLDALLEEMKESRNKIYNDARTCDWLILDDAGTQRPNSWNDEQLFRLVDSRVNNGRPIVLTTNAVSEDGLRQALNGARSARTVSRLMGSVEKIWLPDERDYRRKTA